MTKRKTPTSNEGGDSSPSNLTQALDAVFALKARVSPYVDAGKPTAQSPEAWAKRFRSVVKDVIAKSS